MVRHQPHTTMDIKLNKFIYLFLVASVWALGSGRTHAQCIIDIPQDTLTIYHGYVPLACITLNANSTGEVPLSYLWSNGADTDHVTACDTITAWYFVTITGVTGCTATDSILVNVVDVRCGKDNDKVYICHVPPGNPANAHAICVGQSAVAAHLEHGCTLDPCSDTGNMQQLQMEVSSNPVQAQSSVTILSRVEQTVSLNAVDGDGRIHANLFAGKLAAGQPVTIPLEISAFPEQDQLIWLRLQGRDGQVTRRVLFIQ